VHGSVVMKREARGVGPCGGPLLKKREKWGTLPVRMIQIKNEQRYNRDAGEGGHPPSALSEERSGAVYYVLLRVS
jgi:hypothetical protein